MRAFSKKILDDIKLDFKDVLIKPKSSKILSRQNVNLERSFRFKYYPKELNCIPIMASNMATIGTPQMAKTLAENKCLTVLHKFISDNDISELDTNYSIISTGINKQDIERATYIIQNSNIDKICIDIANGYLSNMITTIKYFRTMFPDILIIAGNIVTSDLLVNPKQLPFAKQKVTPNRSLELIAAGADIIKVGIGSGACCLTRLKTGIGYPQLSAVIECYEDTHSEQEMQSISS
jgi:GMP reductase